MMIFDRPFSYKIYFHLSIIILLFMACTGCRSNADGKGASKNKKSISYFKLPKPGESSSEEKKRIEKDGEAFFEKYLKNASFAGGILVAKDGEILYEKYTGTVAPGSSENVDKRTAFHIASVSKTFTAMTVLHLAQQGKIDIDKEFSYYFPAFNYGGITVKSLLNHRSGLPNYPYFMEKLWEDKTKMLTNDDMLQFLISKKDTLPPAVTPDTRFSYCNTNYALLALLIEKVTNLPYPVYMKDSIFIPLRMNDTHVFVPADTNSVTMSYTWRKEKIDFNFLDAVYGDKNIYSTPRDLLLWDRFLKSNLFLSEASLVQAYTPYSNERAGVKNYGFGWRMLLYPNNKKIVFHNGWWHGNTAAYMRLLDEGVTIVVLNNLYSSATYKAKFLANSFYPYFNMEVDDDELSKETISDSTASLDAGQKKDVRIPKK